MITPRQWENLICKSNVRSYKPCVDFIFSNGIVCPNNGKLLTEDNANVAKPKYNNRPAVYGSNMYVFPPVPGLPDGLPNRYPINPPSPVYYISIVSTSTTLPSRSTGLFWTFSDRFATKETRYGDGVIRIILDRPGTSCAVRHSVLANPNENEVKRNAGYREVLQEVLIIRQRDGMGTLTVSSATSVKTLMPNGRLPAKIASATTMMALVSV